MSRLGCKCGHIMGSTESPSPYSIYVYYESEIKPNILLSEFIDNLSKAYYTSIDENTIYVVSKDSNELLYIYELEEVYTSDIW